MIKTYDIDGVIYTLTADKRREDVYLVSRKRPTDKRAKRFGHVRREQAFAGSRNVNGSWSGTFTTALSQGALWMRSDKVSLKRRIEKMHDATTSFYNDLVVL